MSRQTENAVNESKNTDSEEGSYPSPKEAIFSDSIPNLRCAIEYVVWQLSYMLLVVFGGLIVGATTAGYVMIDSVCETSRKSGLAETVQRVVEDERVISGAKYAAKIVLWGMAVGATLFFGYRAYTNFWTIAEVIGILLGVFGVTIVLMGIGICAYDRYQNQIYSTGDQLGAAGNRLVSWIKTGTRSVADRGGAVSLAAQNTPGVRRIYGECPVHPSIQPKWFASLLERLEDDD